MFSIIETIFDCLLTPLVCIILTFVINEIFDDMSIEYILEAVLGIVGLISSIKLCCNKIYKGFCIVMCLFILLYVFNSAYYDYNDYDYYDYNDYDYNDYEDDNYSNYDYNRYDYEDDNYSNYDYNRYDYDYDYDYDHEIVESPDLCFKCGGRGSCVICHGMGYTTFLGQSSTCNSCNGTGTCNRCNGSGYE